MEEVKIFTGKEVNRPDYFEKIKMQSGSVRGNLIVKAKGVFRWLSDNGWEVSTETKYYTTGRKSGRVYIGSPKHHEIPYYVAKKEGYEVSYRSDTSSVFQLCNKVVDYYTEC